MIIVYGGTFNPPTRAHEKIADLLICKYKPEKFIFLPVGDNYTWKSNFANFVHRKNMLEIMFKKKVFKISTLENMEEYKGTYWALNSIKEAYKSDVYFVMGADNLLELDKWINYQKLIKENKFIVLTRKGYDATSLIQQKYLNYHNNFEIVNFESEISSKEFRENSSLNHYLNKRVIKYIKKNNLYEVNNAKT